MASLEDILGRYGFSITANGEWDQSCENGEGEFIVTFAGPSRWEVGTRSVTPRGLLRALADALFYTQEELKREALAEFPADVNADDVTEEDSSVYAESVNIERIMDSLELPIEVTPEWDADEAIARFDVRLADNSFIALWPRQNSPAGIALALADELEHLAISIRVAVDRKRITKRENESPAVA